MTSMPGRKYKIGDAVVWTDDSNGMRHPCMILGYAEPGPDDDHDQAANGPLYTVRLAPGDHRVVAEVNLSPSDGLDAPPPADPFSSYDAERIAKETGGVILATLQRGNQDRLTIGAFEHPHKMRSLNVVTIRMMLDGKPTDGIDLGIEDVDAIFAALHEAVHICWPSPPGPPFEPVTDWSAPPDDEPDPPCPRCGYVPGDSTDET
jgi:hypothetical protein